MLWYSGSIAEAVAASKKQGAIFVVYVEGKGESSEQFSNSIENTEVSKKLEGSEFVAIKVEEGTIPYQQFTEIYKQATAPSLFFIGKTGAPIEIVQNPNELLVQINGVLLKAGFKVNVENASSSFIQNENDAQPEVNETKSEEKVERAKELIDQINEKKRTEEEEKEKSKELERRKVGQDMQKLKRWQKDQELKDMVDERNRERNEDLEARRKILAIIEQDKAERAARFAKQTETPTEPTPIPQNLTPSNGNGSNSNIARLQFRLPDGTSHTHDFDSSATLQSVRSYIVANLNLPFQTFTLSTTFPKREFTGTDNDQTLLALNLVPNAVVLILPLYRGTVSTNNTGWFDVVWAFFTPLFNLLGSIRSRLFGGEAREGADSPAPKRPAEDTSEASQSLPKRRMGPGDSTVIRRQGNVYRLTDRKDSDDDNNTWNGNSTQQM